MKRSFVALTLLLAASVSTLAGEIPTMGVPKTQSEQTTSPTLLGEIPTSGKADSLSGAALSAILTALGLASF